jgi:O-antigen ligase
MASTARSNPAVLDHRRTRWDLAGLGIVVALAGWTLVASVGRDQARPLPVLALLGCCLGLFAAGRAAERHHGELVPQLVALAVGGTFLLTFPGVLSSGGAPTDYGNTNGTLAGLGGIAAAAAATSSRGAARRGWVALAIVLVACMVLSESVAAASALSVAAALAVVALVRRRTAVACLGGLVATFVAVGTTTALALGAGEDFTDGSQSLRLELWDRALDLLRDAPLRGHGPGSFAPPLEFWDADLRWAHHDYLQQGAEAGIVGLLLLLVLVAWLFGCLWSGRRRGLARTIAGASAVTLVALHAAVDHVLHTAAVPLTLAVLVGWATADPGDRETPGSPLPPR